MPFVAARLMEQARTSGVAAVHATTVTDMLPVTSVDGATLLATGANPFAATTAMLNQVDAAPVVADTPVELALAAHEEENIRTIVHTMRMQLNNGSGSAVMSLRPDYLGEVTIALHVNGGAVEATMHAANPDVRAWLQANEASLRQGLAAQGLSLERFNVADEAAAKRDAQQQQHGRRRSQPQAAPEPRRQQRRDSTQVFNVVV